MGLKQLARAAAASMLIVIGASWIKASSSVFTHASVTDCSVDILEAMQPLGVRLNQL